MPRLTANLLSMIGRPAWWMAAVLFNLQTGGLIAAETPSPRTVEVPAMRTSIYIGSVTLTVSPLERMDGTFHYAASYEARVVPWLFWSESGTITLNPTEADLGRLSDGETIEVTGHATNHRGKPRTVSARIQPEDADAGTIKVRIDAGGTQLIFNGSYRFTASEVLP